MGGLLRTNAAYEPGDYKASDDFVGDLEEQMEVCS